jgi:hypothetical protein
MRGFLLLISALGFLWLVDVLAFDARYSKRGWGEAKLRGHQFSFEVQRYLRKVDF